MKAIFVYVEAMELQFKWVDVDWDAPEQRAFYGPAMLFTSSKVNEELKPACRFLRREIQVGSDFFPVYIWDKLWQDAPAVELGVQKLIEDLNPSS